MCWEVQRLLLWSQSSNAETSHNNDGKLIFRDDLVYLFAAYEENLLVSGPATFTLQNVYLLLLHMLLRV